MCSKFSVILQTSTSDYNNMLYIYIERERQRETEGDRETERQTERQRDRETESCVLLIICLLQGYYLTLHCKKVP